MPQTRPNAAFLRSASGLDYTGLGYPVPVAPATDPLEVRVAAAVAYVEQLTGRIPLEETVPAALWPIAQEAVRMRAEQATIQAGADYVSDASDDLLQSFSAGSYSESRKSGGASGASSKAYRVLNSNAALVELLWLLMTPEMRAYWEAVYRGEHAPAWGVTEEYWDADNVPNYSYGYGAYPYQW